MIGQHELDRMRMAAEEAARVVGDGEWVADAYVGGPKDGRLLGSVYTRRAVVRVNKSDGDLSRSGYNGRNVLITMGTSASRRDRATAAHIAASCPATILRLIDAYEQLLRKQP